MKTVTKVKIRHHAEEGSCEECGCPLDVGMIATYDESDRLYCSSACAVREDCRTVAAYQDGILSALRAMTPRTPDSYRHTTMAEAKQNADAAKQAIFSRVKRRRDRAFWIGYRRTLRRYSEIGRVLP